jgi:anaerobic selenocysteine-containing dehydrogenase
VLYAPDRVQQPLRRGPDGEHIATTWEEALAEIAGRLASLNESGNSSRIALLTGEPSRLFHDLAQQFMRALGSPSIVHMNGDSLLPFTLTQGITEGPGYDLQNTDLVLSFGLDIFEDGPTPLHAVSALIGCRSSEERAALIHVGTRLSPSASKAEIRVPILPGTYGAFALGVAQVLVREGNYDSGFVSERTFGFDDWEDEQGRRRLGFRRLLMEQYYPDRVAQICGCDAALIVRVARRFADSRAAVAMVGGNAVQGSNAVYTVMAAHALNALSGNMDQPGGVRLPSPVPFAPMPTPRVLEESAASSLPPAEGIGGGLGGDPVSALVERVLGGSDPVEVLFVIGANPVHSSPAGSRLRQAMKSIPTVVVMADSLDDTAINADFLLPSPVPLESWQESTTPGNVAFSTVGVGKPVVDPLYESRHPADVLLDLARRLGGAPQEALPWSDYPTYLKHRLEGLAVSGQGSVVTGSFDDSWVRFLEERGWRFLAHEGIEGLWTDLVRESAWWNPVHTGGDWRRLFPSPSGRYEFFSRSLERRFQEIGANGAEDGDPQLSEQEALDRGVERLGLVARGDEACLPHYEPPLVEGDGELLLLPFRPITARSDLGVTSPMVLEMFGYQVFSGWQTWAEIAPETAVELGLEDGDEVKVESDGGSLEAVVRVVPGAAAGTVHMPVGLGHEEKASMTGRIGANPIAIMLPVRDPLSERLALASTRVQVRLVRRGRHRGLLPGHGGDAA